MFTLYSSFYLLQGPFTFPLSKFMSYFFKNNSLSPISDAQVPVGMEPSPGVWSGATSLKIHPPEAITCQEILSWGWDPMSPALLRAGMLSGLSCACNHSSWEVMSVMSCHTEKTLSSQLLALTVMSLHVP